MEPVSAAALGFAAAAMSGAGEETGRRLVDRLGALARRTPWGRRAAPSGAEEREELLGTLAQHARTDPEFARELRALLTYGFPGAAPEPSAPPVRPPQTLPATTVYYTNHTEALALCAETAERSGHKTVELTGPAGIGKTTLGAVYGHRNGERFPDGRICIELGDPAESLGRVLRLLDVAGNELPSTLEGRTDLYRTVVADRHLLIVLDNARSLAQVDPFLTPAEGVLVIVTARRPLGLAGLRGARPVPLKALSEQSAAELLTLMIGTQRASAELAAFQTVIARLGGSPLALCSVGGRLLEQPALTLAEVAAELADQRGAGHGEDQGVADEDPVWLTARAAYRALSPTAAQLWRALAARPWPSLTTATAAATTGISEAEARPLLAELTAAQLLETVDGEDGRAGEERRYRFRDTLRQFAERAARREDGEHVVDDTARRTVRHLLDFAVEADYCALPKRWHLGPRYAPLKERGRKYATPKHALAALRRERDNLAEAVRAAGHLGESELVWQLCEAMWALHLKVGFRHQGVSALSAGVRSAEPGSPVESRMRTHLGFLRMWLGDYEAARREFRAVADVERAAGRKRGHATAVESQGLVDLAQWHWEDAERHFREALEVNSAIREGDTGWVDVTRARALLVHHTGRALRGQGRYEEAVDRLVEARRLMRDVVKERYNEIRVLTSLAETLLVKDGASAAVGPLDEALAAMETEGAETQQADVAVLRAACAHELGEPGEAFYLRRALGIYETNGDPASAARMRARLAGLG